MLGTGYFLKSQKLIPSKKNQSVLIAKIRSRKTQKIANPQKINSRKNFLPHGYVPSESWIISSFQFELQPTGSGQRCISALYQSLRALKGTAQTHVGIVLIVAEKKKGLQITENDIAGPKGYCIMRKVGSSFTPNLFEFHFCVNHRRYCNPCPIQRPKTP